MENRKIDDEKNGLFVGYASRWETTNSCKSNAFAIVLQQVRLRSSRDVWRYICKAEELFRRSMMLRKTLEVRIIKVGREFPFHSLYLNTPLYT